MNQSNQGDREVEISQLEIDDSHVINMPPPRTSEKINGRNRLEVMMPKLQLPPLATNLSLP